MEQEIKFEKALADLEKIVEALESGELALEDALKKYEEGVRLARLCTQKLEQAENKIEILTKALNGKVEAASLEKETSEAPKRKQKKSGKSDLDPETNFLL